MAGTDLFQKKPNVSKPYIGIHPEREICDRKCIKRDLLLQRLGQETKLFVAIIRCNFAYRPSIGMFGVANVYLSWRSTA
jgi:hypothetical protein